jgi:transcriptional regulator with XRE-family HTH domain
MSPNRKIRPPSPAAQALAAHGSTQAQLAELLNVTPKAVSHYLAGRRAAPLEAISIALIGLLGADAAAQVCALIPHDKSAEAAAV